MANVNIWDPFNVLRGGNPFSELQQMQRDMARMFGQLFGGNLPVPEVTGARTPVGRDVRERGQADREI